MKCPLSFFDILLIRNMKWKGLKLYENQMEDYATLCYFNNHAYDYYEPVFLFRS